MKKISTYLLFLGIIFFFFKPFFVEGKVPIPIDIPVGMYYPWLNQSFGYAVRPLVKNPILTDTVSQFWIWRNWGVDGLAQKNINIWNPKSLSGYEMSPWFHTIIFSPLNIFYIFFQKIDAASWIIISQTFISLLGCYLLGKHLFKSALSGIGLAVAWTFSSFFTGWITWGTVSATLAFLPWSLYTFEKSITENKMSQSLATIISLSFLLLSGHPQTAMYCFFIFFAWAIFRKKWQFGLYTIALSILVSGIALYPSISIIKNSIRGLDNQLSGVNFGFIPWPKIFGLLFSVNLYGNPATGNYFGGDYNFQEKLINFGTLPLLLLTYSIVKSIYLREISYYQKIGILFFVVGLLLSTEYPLGWIVYKLHIPLISSGPAGRSFVISIFGSAIIFADTLSQFIRRQLIPKALYLSLGILTFGFAFLVGEIVFTKWIIAKGPASLIDSYSVLLTNLNVSGRNLFIPFLTLILSGAILLFFIYKKQFSKIVVVALIAMVLLEGYAFFKKYTPFVPKDLYFPDTPSLSFVSKMYQNSPDFFRIERESAEILPPNMWEAYGFYSSSGYDPVGPANYSNYLTSIGVSDGNSRYVENGNHNLDLLDNLGIKYLLTIKRDESSIPSSTGKIKYLYKENKWKEVFTEGPVSVLENTSYQKPYRLSGNSGTIKLLDHKNSYWKFEVQTSADDTLILMENNSKGWQSRVNKKSVPINTYSGTFKSVNLSSGNSIVEFAYNNNDLVLGWSLSLVGIILSFILIKNKLIY